MKRAIGWASLALWLALGAGPAAAGGGEELAARIQAALAQGREKQACELALQMAPYKGTPAHAQAKTALLGQGISIESPLQSWTLKRIIELQNRLEGQRAAKGDLPRLGLYQDYPDAWGTPLRVEMVSRGSVLYLLRSAGPDRAFMTDDDLAVGTRQGQAAAAKTKDIPFGHKGAAAGPGPGAPPGPAAPAAGRSGDRTVSVEELLGR